MKKRIKFRLRNDLAIPFRISVIICLLCASFSYYLFHTNFFRALSKLGEEPIATITFKYKTAERKFLERVVWDRLRQNSPVYNGDMIHTADLSEATVWFTDGTTLDLAENTMAQVFLHGDGTLGADLEQGSASVDSSADGKGLLLTSEKVQVSVKAGSSLSAEKKDDNSVAFSLQRGNAELASGESVRAGESILVSDEGQTSEAAFTMLSPVRNQKFLYYTEDLYTVNFAWKGSLPKSDLALQIAKDKEFNTIIQNINASGINEISVSLPKGIYYWRVSDIGGEMSQGRGNQFSSGKFQIIQSLKPELVVPVENFSYTYRKQSPSVRFIWRESEAATAYSFAVSKSPDMKNPIIEQRSSSSSIIISTLPQGIYYYQITPFYIINRVGLANPSKIGSFRIERQGELTAPVLVSPINAAFVDKTKHNENLSWRMDEESVTYRILVSRNQNLSNPIISRETGENYIPLSSSDLKNLRDGEYFWAVTQIDSEGNVSPRSEIRSFYAVTGEIEQRTIFPPEGYSIWKPLLSDTRFTWKTNLELMQYIQLATDKEFKNIVFDSETAGNSFSGANLDYGEYYWRVTTKDENFSRATPPKHLTVVGEIPAPKILEPSVSKKAVARPTEPCKFVWNDPENAGYYRIKIYRGESEKPVYDENFITGSEVFVDVEKFEEGRYRWEIQSYLYETETSSRRSSMLSESEFQLRKIRPVTLSSPKNGTKIGGWEAIENPPVLRWASRENYSKAQLVLSKKSGIEASEKVFNQTSYSQKLPPLSSGTYEWTVNALTYDELDISATQKYSFTVEEIPPFPAPENARTATTSVFNAAYLRQSPYIVFEWKTVPRAQGYILEILRKKTVMHREIISDANATSFKYTDLSKLAKGDFTWTVKAVQLAEDKKEILIDGIPARNTFTIDYTINAGGGKRQKKGELYAQ